MQCCCCGTVETPGIDQSQPSGSAAHYSCEEEMLAKKCADGYNFVLQADLTSNRKCVKIRNNRALAKNTASAKRIANILLQSELARK